MIDATSRPQQNQRTTMANQKRLNDQGDGSDEIRRCSRGDQDSLIALATDTKGKMLVNGCLHVAHLGMPLAQSSRALHEIKEPFASRER